MVFEEENIKNLEFNEENFVDLKNTAIDVINEIKEAHDAIHNSNKMLTEQAKTITDLNDKYLRALADYQNLKRTSSITISNSKEAGKISVLKNIIPILDDFEKAVDAGEVSDGVKIIYNNLKSMFASEGVEVINPEEGDKFDDSIHEAIAPVSNPEFEKNTIAFTQFKGYKLGDKILRYAKVGVYV